MTFKRGSGYKIKLFAGVFVALLLVFMALSGIAGSKNGVSAASETIITSDPADASVIRGSKAKFTVKAEGDDLKYQWQVSMDDGATWKKSGAAGNTTSSISMTSTDTLDGRMFRCCVIKGTEKYYSKPAKLTTLAVISGQPGNKAVNVGSKAVFTIKSRSTKAAYQWQVSMDGGKTWKNSGAEGCTTVGLTVSTSVKMDNYVFRCKVTNGTWVEYSSKAVLRLKPVIKTQPKNTTGYNGYTTKLSVTAVGVDLKYQWQVSSDGEKWANSKAEGSDTRILSIATTAGLNGKRYRCRISSGSYVIYSEKAVLKVKTKIITQPKDVNAYDGKEAVFSVKAAGTGLKYQWQVSTNGGSTWNKSSSTGATTAKLTINALIKHNKYMYRCIITDGTLKTISDSATLYVEYELSDDEKARVAEVKKYSYEIVPLTDEICNYFYLKTDNPDPNSFYLVDEKTRYAESSVVFSKTGNYGDVKYLDASIGRVNGGYIFQSANTDGGIIEVKVGFTRYDYSDGYYRQKTIFVDTGITMSCPALKDEYDYLIQKYSDSSMSFFEKMDAIESGFSSECLYQGVWIRGVLHKSETSPYYGISTSPHVDQNFYIQDPYYRDSSKGMLISALYPFRYDSLGFPSMMGGIAKKLEPTATYKWSSAAHYLIEVTFDGETRTYGGAGYGGGQAITEDDIIYHFNFDGKDDDSYGTYSLPEVKEMIQVYGSLTIPNDIDDSDALTWAKVRKQVGTGKHVRLVLLTSIYGGSSIGYSYLYDDTSYGGSLGYMHNTWFGGRYYNKWEYFYPGADFEQTVADVQPSLTFKDPVVNIPNDGRTYYIYGYKNENGSNVYKARPVEEYGYDASTKKWSGYVRYYYDSENSQWYASSFPNVYYIEDGRTVYLKDVNSDYTDSLTITMAEAKKMNIDRYTNVDPSSFLIYDMKSPPGTKGSN
ncbi:hypothetical protein SAMN04487934_10377 [Eubacterium ruminantium]|nr:hypothetical protein SAMN04487934_10377 [Eubacterium ruminantium]